MIYLPFSLKWSKYFIFYWVEILIGLRRSRQDNRNQNLAMVKLCICIRPSMVGLWSSLHLHQTKYGWPLMITDEMHGKQRAEHWILWIPIVPMNLSFYQQNVGFISNIYSLQSEWNNRVLLITNNLITVSYWRFFLSVHLSLSWLSYSNSSTLTNTVVGLELFNSHYNMAVRFELFNSH